jgi:hypothetical protein
MLRLKTSLRIVFTAGVMSVVILAFGFRTEATGFTYATGSGFNLRIDSQAFYNGQAVPSSTWSLKNLQPNSDKFFNFSDIKPGDRGTTTISFHVNKDAWICLDFEKLKEYENERNEPEMLEDNTGGVNSGELADGTEFFAWYDDGDNAFEVGEKALFGTSTGKQAATKVFDNKTYPLADSVFGTAFTASTTRYIGITWCAGDLTVNIATAAIACDATAMGNEAQTDSFTVDVSIRAEGSKDNKKFKCIKKGTTCEYAGPVKVNINNNAVIINNTSSGSNTGGNSAGGAQGGQGGAGGNGGGNGGNGGSGGSGGVVNTGNATSTSSTTNIINTIKLLIGGGRGR